MGFFKKIGKGLGKVVKSVGKVASASVKVVAKTASGALKSVPGVGQIYDAATALVGVDPIEAIGNTMGAVVGGGNIGKDIASGLKDSVAGGLVSILFPSKYEPGETLPETSNDPPGVYTYEDGSYAYTVDVDGKVSYNPGDLTNPPAVAAETPNGSLIPVPEGLGARSAYVKTLLDSYGNPLGADKALMTMSAVNNFVAGNEPLSGEQQSNLIALDVVNKSPEALAYTSEVLSQSTGKSKVDWLAILTGLWNTAKTANIPGVSDTVQKIEDQAVDVALGVAEQSAANKVSRFLRDNVLWLVGGLVLLIVVVSFSAGRKRY